MKKSSFNHYIIPYNQKYVGPTRWKGRIGAGTLDAGAALQMVDVDDFFHDHPDARTFRIKGVKINNRCVPGSHGGVPDPKLEVVMENGKPPYRYRWIAMPDNNALISPQVDSVGVSQINTTVTGVTGSNPNPVFHYRLTVYDNSDIEKVANKIVKIQLTDEDVWDLAMQDAYADMYDEPNQMEVRSYLDWNIWESPDLWNRLTNDGGQEHQDPDTMTTNYLYVRVKNIGCIPSPTNADSASLNLYWSLASTGEVWERDWVGNSTLPGINLPAGGRITPISGIPIPSIDPGAERILSKDWIPPRPQDFDTSGMLTRIDVCALARITTLDSDLGLAFPEIDTTKVNVRNNNNIVTRNFASINLSGSHNTGGVVVSDPSSSAVAPTITVEVTTENQLHPFIHGHLATYMDMELHLGGLYDKWVAGGKQGNPTASNDGMKTVTWDMEKPLRLENITLEENEAHLVILDFNRKEGVNPAYPVVDQMVYFRMVNPVTVDIDNGDGTSFPVVRDNVIGSVNYSINIPADNPGGQKTNPSGLGEEVEKMESWFDVYPNPTDGELTVQVSDDRDGKYRVLVVDMSGRVIFENDKAAFHNGIFRMNTSSFTPGIYFIQLTDSKGKASIRKFVKAD